MALASKSVEEIIMCVTADMKAFVKYLLSGGWTRSERHGGSLY